ncbi:MAG: hypothetical protein AAGK32_15475, partial [Actinomycetota bacterium]
MAFIDADVANSWSMPRSATDRRTFSYFRTLDDLRAKQAEARARRTGQYDCLHLLSGGKDSTYALYQLVAAGFRPYALTLD